MRSTTQRHVLEGPRRRRHITKEADLSLLHGNKASLVPDSMSTAVDVDPEEVLVPPERGRRWA